MKKLVLAICLTFLFSTLALADDKDSPQGVAVGQVLKNEADGIKAGVKQIGYEKKTTVDEKVAENKAAVDEKVDAKKAAAKKKVAGKKAAAKDKMSATKIKAKGKADAAAEKLVEKEHKAAKAVEETTAPLKSIVPTN